MYSSKMCIEYCAHRDEKAMLSSSAAAAFWWCWSFLARSLPSSWLIAATDAGLTTGNRDEMRKKNFK
jgi:hypothetical protein